MELIVFVFFQIEGLIGCKYEKNMKFISYHKCMRKNERPLKSVNVWSFRLNFKVEKLMNYPLQFQIFLDSKNCFSLDFI